jgi:uncharacterized protein (DUF2235 family)
VPNRRRCRFCDGDSPQLGRSLRVPNKKELALGKNIVICCDGTANEFAEDNANVVKLYYTLEQDATKQVTYYHPGLGTMEPAGALTTVARKFTKLLGIAIGYGLSNDIRDVYTFLMEQFEPGDHVYCSASAEVRIPCGQLHRCCGCTV